MHKTYCACPACRSARDRVLRVVRFAGPALTAAAAPMSEREELELAMELLAVSNDAEWEQFLGKLFRGIGRGLKKAGSFVFRRVLRPLGGALKGLAKKALPFVGGALGSLIPIPGVGTAIGTALGSAVGKALELEFGQMDREAAELEVARRVVRIAVSAAQQAGRADPDDDPERIVHEALLSAARAHVPNFAAYEGELQGLTPPSLEAGGAPAASGRWVRRGTRLVVLGA